MSSFTMQGVDCSGSTTPSDRPWPVLPKQPKPPNTKIFQADIRAIIWQTTTGEPENNVSNVVHLHPNDQHDSLAPNPGSRQEDQTEQSVSKDREGPKKDDSPSRKRQREEDPSNASSPSKRRRLKNHELKKSLLSTGQADVMPSRFLGIHPAAMPPELDESEAYDEDMYEELEDDGHLPSPRDQYYLDIQQEYHTGKRINILDNWLAPSYCFPKQMAMRTYPTPEFPSPVWPQKKKPRRSTFIRLKMRKFQSLYQDFSAFNISPPPEDEIISNLCSDCNDFQLNPLLVDDNNSDTSDDGASSMTEFSPYISPEPLHSPEESRQILQMGVGKVPLTRTATHQPPKSNRVPMAPPPPLPLPPKRATCRIIVNGVHRKLKALRKSGQPIVRDVPMIDSSMRNTAAVIDLTDGLKMAIPSAKNTKKRRKKVVNNHQSSLDSENSIQPTTMHEWMKEQLAVAVPSRSFEAEFGIQVDQPATVQHGVEDLVFPRCLSPPPGFDFFNPETADADLESTLLQMGMSGFPIEMPTPFVEHSLFWRSSDDTPLDSATPLVGYQDASEFSDMWQHYFYSVAATVNATEPVTSTVPALHNITQPHATNGFDHQTSDYCVPVEPDNFSQVLSEILSQVGEISFPTLLSSNDSVVATTQSLPPILTESDIIWDQDPTDPTTPDITSQASTSDFIVEHDLFHPPSDPVYTTLAQPCVIQEANTASLELHLLSLSELDANGTGATKLGHENHLTTLLNRAASLHSSLVTALGGEHSFSISTPAPTDYSEMLGSLSSDLPISFVIDWFKPFQHHDWLPYVHNTYLAPLIETSPGDWGSTPAPYPCLW